MQRVPILALVLALSATGCVPEFETLDEPPVVAVCVDSSDDAEGQYGSGEVIEVGTGVPASETPLGDRCLVEFAYRDDLAWLRFESPEVGVWTIAWLVPGAPQLFEVGDAIEVEGLREITGNHSLEIRRGDGRLAAWFTNQSRVGEFILPTELEVAEVGRLRARDEHRDCGSTTYHDFEVEFDGESTSVPYAAEAAVGDYRVLHGGLRLVETWDCTDFGPSDEAKLTVIDAGSLPSAG